MIGIPVLIAPATSDGRLYPRYHNSIGIMTLDTQYPRSCPFGINVDGTLILDFDERGVLAMVELLLPMSRWKGKASTAQPDGLAGSVVLAPPRRTSVDCEWPVTVSKDVQTETARIGFGSADYDRAVYLSKDCCALLLGDRLTGFWFVLRR